MNKMKYELKQKSSEIVIAVIAALLGVALFVVVRIVDGEFFMFGLLLFAVSLGYIIYSVIKQSGDSFLFDEHSFTVGEKRYLYGQIERIKATNFRGHVTFSIYVNNEKIFTFDNNYENVNEFQRMLILNNVHFNPYGD